MTDLDTHLRTTLRAAAEEIDELTPAELVARLRTAPEPMWAAVSARRWSRPLAVAAVLVVVALGAAVLVVGRSTSEEPAADLVTAGPEVAATGFASFGPGWHELEGGPRMPTLNPAGVAWTGEELVIASRGSAWAYSPASDTWRDLDLPDVLGDDSVVDLAWTGEALVAVGAEDPTGPPTSATWDAGTETWTERGTVPTAPELAAALPPGVYGTRGMAWMEPMTWTGTHVIDLARAAVLDPSTWTWSPLPLPADVGQVSALLDTNPVWTGSELVLIAWSASGGLAWDGTGSSVRTIDAPPAELRDSPWSRTPAFAHPVDGGVELIAKRLDSSAGEPEAGRLRWDAATGAWSELPAIPDIDPTSSRCQRLGAVVAGELVLDRCDGGAPVVERDGAWVELPTPPFPTSATAECCVDRWIVADDALVIWRVASDGTGGAEVPAPRIAVWVP